MKDRSAYVVGHTSRTWWDDYLDMHAVLEVMLERGLRRVHHCGAAPFGAIVVHTVAEGLGLQVVSDLDPPRLAIDTSSFPEHMDDVDVVVAFPQQDRGVETADPNAIWMAAEAGVPVVSVHRGGIAMVGAMSLREWLTSWR